jgi:hypothetical protein
MDLIRQFAPRFLTGPAKLAFQVKSVLSKLLLCRTQTLGGHTYVCPPCGSRARSTIRVATGIALCAPVRDAPIGWTRRVS